MPRRSFTIKPGRTANEIAIAGQAAEYFMLEKLGAKKFISDEHRASARRHGIVSDVDTAETLHVGLSAPRARFRNALSSQDGSAGQFTSPEGFVEHLEIAKGAHPISGLATVRRVTGNPARAVTVDVSAIEAAEIFENVDNASSFSDLTFGLTSIPLRTWRSRSALSADLEQDSPLLVQELPTIHGTQLGAAENGAWTAQLKIGATNVATAGAGAIAADDIESMLAAISAEYVRAATLMVSPAAFAAMRKLKSGSGEFVGDTQGRLNWRGISVVLNNHLSAVSTGNVVALLGDFSKFLIVEHAAVSFRTDAETLAHNNQLLVHGRHRAAGVLMNCGANVPMTKLTVA